MNYKLVFRLLGNILRIETVCLLLPLAVSLSGDGLDKVAFIITAALTGIVGQMLSMLPNDGRKMQARDGYATVALCWIVMSAFGALPYVFSGAIPNYIDAFFETVSGFTTTGATVLTEIESLPRGILFWRAQTQWMGGVGVLVLILALLPKAGEGSVYLMRAESPGPIKSKLVPKVGDTAKILYSIYLTLTAAEIICLRIAGMNWYEAITHAFTTISTGGFSVKNASIAAYNSMAVDWIIIVFMFLSGVNFSLLYFAVRRNFKAVFQSEELRFYTCLIFGSAVLITANLVAMGGRELNFKTFTDALFQVVTVATTTGYATVDYALWPTFACVIIFMLMVTGACAGSTAGGVKSIRVILLFKNLRREVHRILHPREVQTIRVDGERVEEDVLTSVTLFFFAYIAIFLVGAIVVSWDNVGFTEALSAALTCLGNVGPALGTMGPTGNFSALSGLSKVVLSFCMLLGRLEILPLLLLAIPSMWKKR